MPTGMCLPSFGSVTSKGNRGVSQANNDLKLASGLGGSRLKPSR